MDTVKILKSELKHIVELYRMPNIKINCMLAKVLNIMNTTSFV